MSERLTAVCAVCGKVLYQGRLSLTDPGISHGYCMCCSLKELWLDGATEAELTGFHNKLGGCHA
ncbi:hypothetical protein KAR91_52995 [Candidatus Pacearchaeota archaeon]|nr:hypothetical protein [Candidatus Pacearchaeota archaeon]